MIGGQNIALSLKALKSNELTLAAGATWMIPAGSFFINPGPYTYIQFLDPVSQLWRTTFQQNPNMVDKITSDGGNFRLANLSGCAVGAVVTNAGSSYTSAPTVTPSAGGSLWKAIVGGLINTSPTVPSAAGSNYTYPPICFIDPPPTGGIQATATCALSGGAVNSITITNQGAGYITAPNIYFFTDERDPNNPITFPGTTSPVTPCGTVLSPNLPGYQVGFSSSALAITGSGTIAAVVCTDPGNAVTSLPTLSFSGGGGSSGAATVVANFAVTGFTATTGGTGYGNAMPFAVRTITGLSTASATHTNPAIEKGLTQPRPALVSGTSTAGGAITATGAVVQDSGIGFQAVPTCVVDCGITGGAAPPTAVAVATATVGGVTDTTFIIPSDS